MIVIADTSPLNYLILIGQVHLLERLYGRVAIPDAVVDEMQQPATPGPVANWISRQAGWLDVMPTTGLSDASLEDLDAGERAAILLAQQHLPEVLLLIDDDKGRREASRRGIRTTGTLGVLNDAAQREFVDLPSALEQLRMTSFRASPRLLEAMLKRHAERR